MAFLDWAKQTIGNVSNRLKQTANTASNGLKWLHENVIQPGARIGKAIGGDIGKFAQDVETGANAVHGLNEKYRTGSLNPNDFAGAAKQVKEAVHRGRESAGGAKRQVAHEISKAKKIIKTRDFEGGAKMLTEGKHLGKKVGRAVQRVY